MITVYTESKKSKINKLFKLIMLFLTFSGLLMPQRLHENIILPFDGLKSDWFGNAVEMSGGFVFISSTRYSNTAEGAVYVYKLENHNLVFIEKIRGSDTQERDLFSTRLYCFDKKLYVVAQNKKINNVQVGCVYVFENVNGNWMEKSIINPPEPHSHAALFGNSLFKNGNYLLIGAPGLATDGVRAGKVFLYEVTGNNYNLLYEFAPFDPKIYQYYGSSLVMLDSNKILIGSPGDNTEMGQSSGSIYEYEKEDSDWVFRKKHLPETSSDYFSLATSMVTSNGYVFVGSASSYYYRAPGEVYIYKYSLPELSLVQIIDSGEKYEDDRFGIEQFAKGDSLFVSAMYDTVNGYKSGSVFLFRKIGDKWEKVFKFRPSNEHETRDFGKRVVARDDLVLIGAPLSKVNGLSTHGKAFLYSPYIVPVEEEELIVGDYFLSQNFPNPFNPVTTIKFSIPSSPVSRPVSLKLFDVLGREVAILINEEKTPGNYEVKWNASGFPSGIYFYRITVGKYSETKKMVLTK